MAQAKQEQSSERAKWDRLISQRKKDLKEFWQSGEIIEDTYRIESKSARQSDKYNILYSNTETIRPSLYAQTPKVELQQRQRDQNNPLARAASAVLEAAITYVVDEQPDEFDGVVGDAVLDLLLPGLGQARLRYVPTYNDMVGQDGTPILEADGKTPVQEVTYETVTFDYVNWKDFMWSKGRRWSEVWWVSFGAWMDKAAVTQRFGRKIADKMTFNTSEENTSSKEDVEQGQAYIYQIEDKKAKKVLWFSFNYADGILDEIDDPLKLKGFFSCPKPLRAVASNKTFLPRPYYAQYQAQADELNDITRRIRLLVRALRVIGVYDSSVDKLRDLLKGDDNKMVPVEGWSTMQEKGGLKGVVDFLPIQELSSTLIQLYDARDRVKAEIYEITGWSDIIRGASKASETLGAQQIKADWARSRLKLMQKEVQRFIRDLFRIAAELISEHYSAETLAITAGLQYEDPDSEIRQIFGQVVQLLKDDRQRCNLVGVETDSTLLPDETQDKQERMEFVSAAGAFLQQSVPAMESYPPLGPLLGEILMFAVRSFRGARPLEATFEQFRSQLEGNPPKKPEDGKSGEDPQAKAQAALAAVNQKAQEVQQKGAIEGAKLDHEKSYDAAELELERQKEENRHNEAMQALALKADELRLKSELEGTKIAQAAHSDQEDRAMQQDQQADERQFRQQEAAKPDKGKGGT